MAQSGSANAIGSVSGDSFFSWQNSLVTLSCNWQGGDLNLYSKNYEDPFSGNIEITATPEGGNTDLVKGHCKRITFSYTFPERARYYVAHIAMNGVHDRGKYVTWCGLFLKEVCEVCYHQMRPLGFLLVNFPFQKLLYFWVFSEIFEEKKWRMYATHNGKKINNKQMIFKRWISVGWKLSMREPRYGRMESNAWVWSDQWNIIAHQRHHLGSKSNLWRPKVRYVWDILCDRDIADVMLL